MSLLHQIALTKVNGIGPILGRQLISHFTNAENIFSASKKDLKALPGIGLRLADAIANPEALRVAEQELQFVEKHGIQVFCYNDKHYPKRLAECPDAPLVLYYKGTADLNAQRTVSIVGTRNATTYGKSICDELVSALTPYQTTIISGLAYGIDSYAHRHALTNGIPTVGVLGHGLDRIYPATNRSMAAKMLESGGLLTEFTSGTNPDRQNFPMRNRIIAGLADVVVVIEAAAKGGALITAEIANTYNRDVCAFPGNLKQEFSAGCNYLIKTYRAHLITGAKDLEYLMNWEPCTSAKAPRQLQFPTLLNGPEQAAYEVIHRVGQIAIDDLSLKLQWPQSKLAITLLEMELKGAIVSLPGKIYRIV